jgi:hypothetical protein
MRVLNFGHMSQEEVSMIMFTDKGDTFDFIPPRWLIELNEEAEKRGLAVLFLDEWNRGDKAMVNALFTVTDERRIHNYHLHENVLVVAAMNPSDGTYLVNEAEKDHAIRKRLNFIYCTADLNAFLDNARKSSFHGAVIDFIVAQSTYLYDKQARDAGKQFTCPANWEKVSNILHGAEREKIDFSDNVVRALVEGQIGKTAAEKFLSFLADRNTLIQPKEILFDYDLRADVRKRVAAMVNCKINRETQQFEELENGKKNRASVISELNRGLAIELFSSQPDPVTIAPRLALYMGDLPNELLGTLAAQHFHEESNARGTEGAKYLERLSTALGKQKPYQAKVKVILEAHRKYKEAAKLINAKDPLSNS